MSLKSVLLQALADARSGAWAAAHAAIDELEHPLAAWLHASLHREEGDEGNARYWYSKAGRPFSTAPFDAERAGIEAVVRAFDEREPAR